MPVSELKEVDLLCPLLTVPWLAISVSTEVWVLVFLAENFPETLLYRTVEPYTKEPTRQTTIKTVMDAMMGASQRQLRSKSRVQATGEGLATPARSDSTAGKEQERELCTKE